MYHKKQPKALPKECFPGCPSERTDLLFWRRAPEAPSNMNEIMGMTLELIKMEKTHQNLAPPPLCTQGKRQR